jgi:hypothetical protein
MAEPSDPAALIRPDDRVAWSGGPMEPASLLRVLVSFGIGLGAVAIALTFRPMGFSPMEQQLHLKPA